MEVGAAIFITPLSRREAAAVDARDGRAAHERVAPVRRRDDVCGTHGAVDGHAMHEGHLEAFGAATSPVAPVAAHVSVW